jgi:hypothetical protein
MNIHILDTRKVLRTRKEKRCALICDKELFGVSNNHFQNCKCFFTSSSHIPSSGNTKNGPANADESHPLSKID